MTGETREASLHMQRGRGIARIYRVKFMHRILGTIFCLAVTVGLAAMVGLVVLNNEGPLPVSKVAGVSVLGVLALVFLWQSVLQLASKITLTDDAIASSLCGRERVLTRADIAGFREVRHRSRRFLTIVPIDPRLKPLTLGPDLATDASFEAWIAALPDLNAEDFKASEARILGDRSHGATPQARLARLEAVRTLAKLLNAVAVVVAAWCLVAPWPYPAAIGAAAVLPLLALIMVAVSGGLVRFTRSATEAHAGAAAAPVSCAAVLVWRVSWDVYLVDLNVAMEVGGIIGLVLLALAVIVDRSLIRFLAIAAVVAVTYGISVVTLANVQLDRSPGEDFQSRVVDSHVRHRKNSRTYSVMLAPWGPRQSAAEVSVQEAMFNRLTMPGSVACIRLYDGAFGIRWFSLDVCRQNGSHADGPFTRFDQVAPGTDPFGPPRPMRCPPGQEPISGWPLSLDCRAR
jgi:hypothetical protein